MKPVIALWILLLSMQRLSAKTWHVSPGGDLRSVQQAVKLSKAGDTIEVARGTYFEKNLVIDRRVYLKGIGNPVLDGQHAYEIVSVKAPGVTMEGFTVRYSGQSSLSDIAGIKVYNVANVCIRNNMLIDNFFGIYCQGAVKCTIANNQLLSHSVAEFEAGDGIHCWKSDSLHIYGNTISGFRDGIYFEFVTNSLIGQNYSQYNVRYGLHFMFSHNDEYNGNTFKRNGTGVTIMYTHGLHMHNNIFAENWGSAAYAILMKDITDSEVDHNRFEKNTAGIYMEGTTRVKVTNNAFHANGWALKIQASCSDNTITGNNFTGNTFDVVTNGSLVLSTFNRPKKTKAPMI